ncbi:MAG TPA: phospho-N-acetylmuramoyl-pentapeptide-transferase [Candidatus Caenarcaniphilales bacterium]
MLFDKVFEHRFTLSGRNLFLLLVVGLSGAALALDGAAGRTWQLGGSLTLPLWSSALVTGGLGYWVVPLLRSLKMGQFIREDGPQSHLKKAGTPTMGGIFFIPVAITLSALWTAATTGIAAEVVAAIALTVAYGFIGWLDDWQVLRYRSNQGIPPKLRLGLELGCAALFCVWLGWSQPQITTLAFPFGLALPLGLLFWLLALFVGAAQSNAINLTDGLDGLAAGTNAIALLGLGALIMPTWPGLTIFCACLSGSCLGFLAHNFNPARVFMGDTGSLALGGALTAVGLITNTLWALLLLSGIFFVETLSVIAQVTYYKATKNPDGVGKRLLKMAPLHHHLELIGWSETQVAAVFYSVGSLLVLACLLINYFFN